MGGEGGGCRNSDEGALSLFSFQCTGNK
jgi:hypothetical protein